jgi:hypothetical protein
MVDYNNMSSDRLIAVRVMTGEIDRIRIMLKQESADTEFLTRVIEYLKSRIECMKAKGWHR